jgi:hypothetical protein
MYKYVLTHQPNLISLYALGRLHAHRQPLPPEEAADRHLKAYPGGYRGPTNRDQTSQRPPHGASGSPPYLASDSHQKAAPGSPQAPGPVSLPVPASASPPVVTAGTCHPVSHYQVRKV